MTSNPKGFTQRIAMWLKSPRQRAGFTLIEIIIAVGILAAMTLTLSEISTNIVENKDKSEKKVSTRHAITIALGKLTSDLRMAFITDDTQHGKDSYFLTGFIGNQESANFSTLSNVHFVKNQKDTDQAQVGYRLEKNDQGYYNLIRRQTNYLMEKLDQGGQSFVLLKDVQEMNFSYYDSNKKDWQEQWDTESISYAGRLPQMVKVKLVVLGEELVEDEDERKEYSYEVVVPVAMYQQKLSW